MNKFTSAEIEYLQSQRLGQIATVNGKGDIHVVLASFRYNSIQDTIDIGDYNIVPSKKYRSACACALREHPELGNRAAPIKRIVMFTKNDLLH
jgi:hypothetical protein